MRRSIAIAMLSAAVVLSGCAKEEEEMVRVVFGVGTKAVAAQGVVGQGMDVRVKTGETVSLKVGSYAVSGEWSRVGGVR